MLLPVHWCQPVRVSRAKHLLDLIARSQAELESCYLSMLVIICTGIYIYSLGMKTLYEKLVGHTETPG